MKILHVLLSLAPRRGGPVGVVKSMACEQSRQGHEVTICTTNEDYPRGILYPPGLHYLCDGKVPVHAFAVQFRPLKISIGLGRYLLRRIESFDIIHVHGLYRFPSTFAAFVAHKYRVPYVIRPHGTLDPYLYRQSSVNVALKRLYENLFDIPNLNGASAIHYTADDERNLASFLRLKAPSLIIPNGIDWDRFERLPLRGSFRSMYAIGNVPLVLFLGRLHHKKGLDVLILAFAQVKRTIPSA